MLQLGYGRPSAIGIGTAAPGRKVTANRSLLYQSTRKACGSEMCIGLAPFNRLDLRGTG